MGIETTVQVEVSRFAGMETITNDMDLRDELGLDSLDIVELHLHLEDIFDLEIPDEAANKFRQVQDIVNCITLLKEPVHGEA